MKIGDDTTYHDTITNQTAVAAKKNVIQAKQRGTLLLTHVKLSDISCVPTKALFCHLSRL